MTFNPNFGQYNEKLLKHFVFKKRQTAQAAAQSLAEIRLLSDGWNVVAEVKGTGTTRSARRRR